MIALGGASGALARYGLGGWVQSLGGPYFPWGTFAVNLLGCMGLGFAARWIEVAAVPQAVRVLLTVGFLGAFTTFSTFSYEALSLMRAGAWTRGGIYVAGSVIVGIVALTVGSRLGRVVWPGG